MDLSSLARRLPTRTNTLCVGGCHRQHAVDNIRYHYCQIIHCLHGHAGQRPTRISVSRFKQDRPRIYSSCVLVVCVLLGHFQYQFITESSIQALEAGMPEGSASPLTRRMIYDRLHYLLQHLISLIPTLPSTLQPLLVRSFPHKRQSQVAQTTYIRNLLRISAYCPELADKILATIIDRTIQIDVCSIPYVGLP